MNTLEQFTPRGVAGNDHPTELDRALPGIQAKPGLARRRVGTMALVAVIGKDRPDVAVEADLVVAGDRTGQEERGDGGRESHASADVRESLLHVFQCRQRVDDLREEAR